VIGDFRTGVYEGLRWLNHRRSFVALIRAARELLPGDASFGDPMSTAGASASHLLGRRAWTLQDGRFSLLSEVMLAGLQLADWLEGDVRGVASGEEQSILFLDLRGFSKWALEAPRTDIAGLLRQVDAVVTEAVEAREGVVVKRLGDGAMAIFADCEPALKAAYEAIAEVRALCVNHYQPILRGGLHVGRPDRIGTDYVGLDVNIAARLCEAAPSHGVLISDAVFQRLAGRWPVSQAKDIELRGVPDEVAIHYAGPRADGVHPAT
jgi:adenylate cyclase